jgi:hypothetical protein
MAEEITKNFAGNENKERIKSRVVDPHWFQCGYSILSQCGTGFGCREPNQCGSMRIPIPSHKQLNFYMKNILEVGTQVSVQKNTPKKAHKPFLKAGNRIPIRIRVQESQISADPCEFGSTTLKKVITGTVQLTGNMVRYKRQRYGSGKPQI